MWNTIWSFIKRLWNDIFGVGSVTDTPTNPPVPPTTPTTPPTTPAPPVPTPAPTPTPTPDPPSPTNKIPITVVWINQADTGLNQADAGRIVEALNLQQPHLDQFWNTLNITHQLLPTGATPPQGSLTLIKAYFLPNADVAGALGYHDTDPQGDPYIRVFTETVFTNGGSALSGSLSVSACASHEACEEAVDPNCVMTATAPGGGVWALETADPVQNNFYNITVADGTQVAVSDFVTPAFFDQPSAPGQDIKQYDYLKVLTAQFTIAPGGYAIVNNQQVFGEEYVDRGQSKNFPAARTYRRLHS